MNRLGCNVPRDGERRPLVHPRVEDVRQHGHAEGGQLPLGGAAQVRRRHVIDSGDVDGGDHASQDAPGGHQEDGDSASLRPLIREA